MKRTIIQVSEEQLEILLDNLPAPSTEESTSIKTLREKLTESLNECRSGIGGSAVSDYS